MRSSTVSLAVFSAVLGLVPFMARAQEADASEGETAPIAEPPAAPPEETAPPVAPSTSSQPAQASQPPPPPPSQPPSQPPSAQQPGRSARLGFSSFTGLGAGFHLIPGAGGDASAGAVIEANGRLRLSELFGLRLRLGWGITHFERMEGFFRAGTAVGQWTIDAYVAVSQWLVSGDRAWFLFKLLGSMFAYVGLATGFVIAGLLYAMGPIAATSFLETGLTSEFHFGSGDDFDTYLEAGVGTMFYVDRRQREISPGWGPLVGVGARAGSFGVGAHVLWSPPTLNQTPNGSVLAGGVTVSWIR